VLPLGMVVALTALELLVAFLQAYVFTILTCIYLNDAIHGGH
jgi:F-type H+-transporting ATPase subunit a